MRLKEGYIKMADARYTGKDWDDLTPKERDDLQRELAAMEAPDSPWNTYPYPYAPKDDDSEDRDQSA